MSVSSASGCGTYRLTISAHFNIQRWKLDETVGTKIAFRLRRISDAQRAPLLDTPDLERLRGGAEVPYPDQILDELVLWLGGHFRIGQTDTLEYPKYRAILGATDKKSFDYLVKAIEHCPASAEWFARMKAIGLWEVAF